MGRTVGLQTGEQVRWMERTAREARATKLVEAELTSFSLVSLHRSRNHVASIPGIYPQGDYLILVTMAVGEDE